MRGFTRAFIVAALALLAPAAAFAQASLTGTVKDASGAVLPVVTVEAASDVLTENVRTAVTDGNGRFSWSTSVPVPTWTLRCRGLTPIDATASRSPDRRQRPSTPTCVSGAVEETMTVTREGPVVDERTTTRQQVLNAEVIEALPTAQRRRRLGAHHSRHRRRRQRRQSRIVRDECDAMLSWLEAAPALREFVR